MMNRFLHIHIQVWAPIHSVKLWLRLIEKVIRTCNALLLHDRSSQCLVATPQMRRLRLCNNARCSVTAFQRRNARGATLQWQNNLVVLRVVFGSCGADGTDSQASSHAGMGSGGFLLEVNDCVNSLLVLDDLGVALCKVAGIFVEGPVVQLAKIVYRPFQSTYQ
jgi:hypothetical protein